jgi:hypothetical protein
MKRLSWSKLFTLAALVSLGIVTHGVATAQVTSRIPVTQLPGARVPSASPGTTSLKAWEGFQTTNYLNTEQYLYTRSVASIATGPVNIITIVNRRIAMFDNPNAIITPGGPLTASTQKVVSGPTAYPPTNEALLDVWLGEAVLRNLCPTNTSGNVLGGSTISCLVDHATVRYDQLQGRFLVLMTVTDTGVQTIGNGVTSPRKSSWVLLISKFSTFANLGTAGSSDVFITPTPPAGSTSGVNTNNWSIYYGTSDGFSGATANGNINSLPGIPNADATFDCSAGAIAASGATPTKNCYFPTDARLGIDNDNIVITSPVVNVNYFLPPAGTTPPINTFAGTRVRVIKKGGASPSAGGVPVQSPGSTAKGLYQKSLTATALVAGNQFTADTAGDYYDLYASTGGSVTPLSVFSTGYANGPYTVGPPTASITLGDGLFCEPARVRGRAAASYTNSMTPTVSSQTYLECITSIPLSGPNAGTTSSIYIQPIVYFTPGSGINPPANQGNTVPYYPQLVGDGTVAPTTGMQVATVDPFSNPSTVAQANYLGTAGGPSGPAPVFYVGDDRPHELVMREGHLYSARVGASPLLFQVNQALLSSTVYYDIIQKLTAGAAGISSLVSPLATGAPTPVLLSKWTNTNAWAPQYEVPGNVTTQGQTDPNFIFPWLEKLFVATSYPPMAASDPRISVQAGINCTNNGVNPAIVGGIANSSFAYPGLYDQRCATDAYDAFLAFRDPVTGQLVTTIPNTTADPVRPMIAPSLRGGASTDPNNGSLWNFGLYATRRFGNINGTGQQGSYVSNYDLQFSTTDAHNNPIGVQFSDCLSPSTCSAYLAVQIAANQGLISSSAGTAGINTAVTRGMMAKLVMLSLMDEKAIQAYLQATGGCTTNFADVASDCNGGVSGGTVPLAPSGSSNWRYIEAMFRKHITTGCFANDVLRNFCPLDPLTRGQMAVFLIRAKMNNVYPTVLNGCPQGGACVGVAGGDGFGLSVPSAPVFTDVPSTHAYFLYIQKMYELRITNGVTPIPGVPSYGPDQTLPLGQLLQFVVRAFFY